MQASSARTRGFTAVEVTIVIAILGLLAAVAIPQLAARHRQDQTATLVCRLGVLRTAINRYWAQHDDFPGPGAGDVRRQLVSPTCRSGSCGTGVAFALGPYVQEGDLPDNPVTGTNTLTIIDAMPEAATGASAWIYCRLTGELRANTTGRTEDGVRYFDL